MTPPVGLLTVPESSLADSLRARIKARGVDCRVLDVDAPLHGKPVTIRSREVIWEGTDLLSLGALLLERPMFPWPQPSILSGLPRDEERRLTAISAEREARSLSISAIRIAGDAIPIVNPPRTSHFAAIPAIALDHVRRTGVPTMPWRLGPLVTPDQADEVILDPVGRDHSRRTFRPKKDDTVLGVEAPGGPIASILVIDNQVTAAIGYEHARAWISGEIAGPENALEPIVSDVALKATQASGLSLAEIVVSREPAPRVLFINAGPDLVDWGEQTQGLALDALAKCLVRLTHHASKDVLFPAESR